MIETIAINSEGIHLEKELIEQSVTDIKTKLADLNKPLNVELSEKTEGTQVKEKDIDKLNKPLNEQKDLPEYDEEGFRDLTEEEMQYLREHTNWPDKPEGIQGCKINDEGVIKYPCRRADLAGKVNPESGVEYEKRIVEINGIKVEVVVPKFDSKFDVQLPDELIEAGDAQQFKECNRQLYERIKNDPEFAKNFTEEQIKQIKEGCTNGSVGAPDGYTWHHDAETGKIQLVDSDQHGDSRHTGGKVLWGGGQANR